MADGPKRYINLEQNKGKNIDLTPRLDERWVKKVHVYPTSQTEENFNFESANKLH